MSNGYEQLSLPSPAERPTTLSLIPIAVKEFRRYVIPLASLFAGIALIALLWGLLKSPTYTSSAIVIAEDNNIIAPLMEGRTVTTDDAARAVITREVIFGRRVMDDILETGGWLESDPSPVERERLINEIIGRTSIDVSNRNQARSQNSGLSLIKITYSDSDPKRAYEVTKRFTELLITEAKATKSRESRSAYEFIDQEVQHYRKSLGNAERQLHGYRSANPDALPGTDADVFARIGELRRAIDDARLDLADLSTQERQLQAQLSGEREITTVSRSSLLDSRLAELQAELDRLTLSYTDQHPDVVRARNQIRDVQNQMRSGGATAAASSRALGGEPSLNPLHGQLRAELAQVRRLAAAASSRLGTAQSLLEKELARSKQIVESEDTVSALTREHEVNREIYEDLLKRRENARVSMNLDAEGHSLGFHIQEPATVPLLQSGLRLMHFAAAGLLLAALVPLILLSMLVKHDPRARSVAQIERESGLPVIGTIPALPNSDGRTRSASQLRLATWLVVAVIVAYAAALALKLTRVI